MSQGSQEEYNGKWAAVDDYLVSHLVESDPVLEQVLKNNHQAGLPAHDVAPNQGNYWRSWHKLPARKKFWKSARSARTAHSGWRGHYRRSEKS